METWAEGIQRVVREMGPVSGGELERVARAASAARHDADAVRLEVLASALGPRTDLDPLDD